MKFKGRYPLWFSLAIYWLFTFALLEAALTQTHRYLGYPLDDTYIHMAIAKHFVHEGIWGVSQNGFSSSTSSPLWTLLIALVYRLFGINDWAPLVLCLICGSFTIVLGYLLLRKISRPLTLSAFMLFIVVLIPLPVLTLTGMEHLLHGFLTLWLIYYAATLLSTKEITPRKLGLFLLLCSLITVARYEGLFLIFIICLLFIISKQYIVAVLTGTAGLLPVTIYGLLSTSQGWYFFPNSILLKGNIPSASPGGILAFLSYLPEKLVGTPHILLLVIACLIAYLWAKEQKMIRQRETCLIIIFIMTTLLHMQFAGTGWFYRYEAYLILAGSVIMIDIFSSLIPSGSTKVNPSSLDKYVFAIILGVFLLLPLVTRAGNAFRDYPVAVTNIHEQQYQMGLFLHKYYEGKNVAVDDIGAINYLSDLKVLDLFGIGSMDVAQAKRNGAFDKNTMDTLAKDHNVEIAIIYRQKEGIPPEWIEIGRWQISNNVVCASDTVFFYAPGAQWEATAITNLRDFADQLPSTVSQSGLYMEP